MYKLLKQRANTELDPMYKHDKGSRGHLFEQLANTIPRPMILWLPNQYSTSISSPISSFSSCKGATAKAGEPTLFPDFWSACPSSIPSGVGSNDGSTVNTACSAFCARVPVSCLWHMGGKQAPGQTGVLCVLFSTACLVRRGEPRAWLCWVKTCWLIGLLLVHRPGQWLLFVPLHGSENCGQWNNPSVFTIVKCL